MKTKKRERERRSETDEDDDYSVQKASKYEDPIYASLLDKLYNMDIDSESTGTNTSYFSGTQNTTTDTTDTNTYTTDSNTYTTDTNTYMTDPSTYTDTTDTMETTIESSEDTEDTYVKNDIVTSIAYANGYIYTTSKGSLQVHDKKPLKIIDEHMFDQHGYMHLYDVFVENNTAYIGTDDAVVIYNLKDRKIVSTLLLNEKVLEINKTNNHIIARTLHKNNGKLHVININKLRRVKTFNYLFRHAVFGDYIVVIDDNEMKLLCYQDTSGSLNLVWEKDMTDEDLPLELFIENNMITLLTTTSVIEINAINGLMLNTYSFNLDEDLYLEDIKKIGNLMISLGDFRGFYVANLKSNKSDVMRSHKQVNVFVPTQIENDIVVFYVGKKNTHINALKIPNRFY